MSLRRFQLLVENLPPGNPLERARTQIPWGTTELLMWQVEGRLRELTTLLANVYRQAGSPPLEVTYLDRPRSAEEVEEAAAQAAYDDLMQQQLEDL